MFNSRFLFIVSVLFPLQILAQEKNSLDTTKVYNLQSVQVVSTRATHQTPMAFVNMSKSQIMEVNHGKDIPNLLMLTPSVTITSDAGNGIGYTSISVRGSDNSRINVTANGIPINDAESSRMYWVNIPDFVSSAEDIQIQRGVGTSTNGSGAFGATINIQTEQLGLKPFLGLDVSGGSYASHKETLRFGTGLLDEHWGVQGRISNIGSDGYVDRASSKLNSFFLQGGYLGSRTMVKFITFNGWEETYHAWNYTSRYEQSLLGRTFNSCGAIDYTDPETALKNGIKYYDNQKDFYHQHHYQLLWTQKLPYNLNLNLGIHYTRGDGYYEQYKAGTKLYKYGVGIGKTDLINQKKMSNDFYGFVSSLTFNNQEGLQAIIGGGWNKYICDHFGNITWIKDESQITIKDFALPYKYYDNTTWKYDGNVYGKIQYEFIKGFTVFSDVQYRHTSTKMNGPIDQFSTNTLTPVIFDNKYNYGFFNPKFGVNHSFNSHHNIYASVAISHKEPTRNDYEDNIGKELKAEKLIDWEVGYKFGSQKFSTMVNLYYMNYDNQFVLTGNHDAQGEPIKANSGKSYRIGLELDAGWKPVNWFAWTANATFSKNRNKNWIVTLCDQDYNYGDSYNLGETPISFSPECIFNNVFKFCYKGFYASVQNRYVGEQHLTNTGQESANCGKYDAVSLMLDDYFITNLNLSYTFKPRHCIGIKKAIIGIDLYNIFSKKYDTNGWAYCEIDLKDGRAYAWTDALTEVGVSPAAPFNFMINLSLSF